MVGLVGGGGGGFDYVQSGQPSAPQLGEMWFDVDGGSDGNGEAKVYDGDGWEPTGYTAHGDLTGVTRDAHHPPVDVSGPLTQPADQSLGLSIGDGLDDSNGTLVAALGNGLGVDASGQVYIPTNAVSQSMLGFDTATQSELDNHASDASAHHSPPSQTSSANGGPVVQLGTDNEVSTGYGGSSSVDIGAVVTEVKFTADNTEGNQDGSARITPVTPLESNPTYSVGADTGTVQSKTVSIDPPQFVNRIDLGTFESPKCQLDYVKIHKPGEHRHSI